MSAIPEDQAPLPPKPKSIFNPEPKTNRQQRNNDKVVMWHWKHRGRQYSPGACNRYRLLGREVRRRLAESGYSEADLLRVLIALELSPPEATKIEELPPKLLRKLRDEWSNYQEDIRLRLTKKIIVNNGQ